MILVGAGVFLVAGCGSSESATGDRMPELWCSQTAVNGSPYYIQIFNPTQQPGMCAAATKMFTEEEFTAVPGVKRQCVFDRDEQIESKHGVVSIYSDDTARSIEAAQVICNNAGNDIIG